MRPVTRRSLLMGIASAPAVVLGAETVKSKADFRSFEFFLEGSRWRDARITSATAFGNGHGGSDFWTDDPELTKGEAPPNNIRYSNIMYDWRRSCYHFILELETTGTKSTEFAALIQYVCRNRDGVFAVAKLW